MLQRSFLVLLLVFCLFSHVAAAQVENVKWRVGLSMHKIESLVIGDLPGHVIGIAEAQGMAFFDNGDVAAAVDRFTFDYVNGSGPYRAYLVLTFEDGSAYTVRFVGTATTEPDGKTTSFQGNFSFVAGTGRFAGIQGSGTHTGRRFAPLGTGVGLYFDFSGTYKLSSN
jgi:hypothetical protein